jgi:hypothetical protein
VKEDSVTESPTFGDGWTEVQQTLADALTAVWMERDQWPTYQWVDHHMRREGLDALEVLASFPIMGTRRHNTLSYADVAYDWWATPPNPESRVRLTIAGLARQLQSRRAAPGSTCSSTYCVPRAPSSTTSTSTRSL